MKVEITHDILAKKIYDRIGAEDKMRLKITEFIHDRFIYYQESKVLLSSKDLNYIAPFLDKISIDTEQARFVEKSREEARRRNRRRRATVIGVIATLILISLFSVISWQKALQANERAVDFLIKETKNNIYHLEYETAWEKIQVANRLGFSEETVVNKVVKQLLEIAHFQNEAGHLEQAREKALFAAGLLGKKTKNLQIAEDKDRLLAELSKLDESWSHTLELRTARTKPSMIKLEAGRVWDVDHKWHQINAFEISPTEVTVWQYALYCLESGLGMEEVNKTTPGWGLDQDNPVVNVSWYDAVRFANWMTKRYHPDKDTVYVFEEGAANKIKEIRSDKPGAFRLPTSAEWAYAAKYADEDTTMFIPRDTMSLADQARLMQGVLFKQGWYDGDTVSRAMPVAQKAPTKMGIYDLGGNVWEWCQDDHIGMDIRETMRGAPTSVNKFVYAGETRIMRGGSFSYVDQITLMGTWHAFLPFYKVDAVGFRLVRNLD